MSFQQIEPLLKNVQKPARYTGGELGCVIKSPQIPLRYALCFPDTYEIGMSNLGMKILYGLANRRADCWCERVFAPNDDMEAQMRTAQLPLWGLESGNAIKDFDVIGFTLQYEMCYTNVLNMLDLARLPLRAADRPDTAPLIIAGGVCTCNPLPLRDFFDAFAIGEGEDVSEEILDAARRGKENNWSKRTLLEALAKIQGVYVPSCHDGAARIQKRFVRNLDESYYPDHFVTPVIDVVQDRAAAELFRGCIRGCRFCQAGYLGRPVREKSPAVVNAQCRALCENTGYEELSLLSLSTSDYSRFPDLMDALLDWTKPQKINISVPSLRIDAFPPHVMEKLTTVRRAGLTFAPEAGTQRLRDVINKNITETQVLDTVRQAFGGGWTSVKLYFMLGLPTETQDDLRGIIDLAQRVVDAYHRHPDRQKGQAVRVSVSCASFVPKPFTPFQWAAMDSEETIKEKQAYLRALPRSKKITLAFHDPQTSRMEGIFARGDARLGPVLQTAWEKGAKFDAWDDHFKPELWEAAFAAHGLDPHTYLRERDPAEPLPWDFLDYGVTKEFLLRENKKARAAETTPHCRQSCAACGLGCAQG